MARPLELRPDPGHVLLTGGSGLVGSAVAAALRAHGARVDAPRSAELDVTRLEAVHDHVARHAVDLLINSAAEASVERAERDPGRAERINALGAHNCAIAAAAAGIPLVHISTDYVFDGAARRPYAEVDPTGVPPNVYGRSKLLAEQLVRATWPRHFILRVAAVYGAGRRSFVDWVLEEASADEPLTIVADRFASPTWSEGIARQLLPLVATPWFGTYHCAGQGGASWFELAREALTLAGEDPAGVEPVFDRELPSAAVRAPCTVLDNHLLRLRGLQQLRPWREELASYIATL